MRQAVITHWDEKPKLVEATDLPIPGPAEIRIKVEAVGIHHVVRARASGKHYSSGTLPHIPGVDGVGTAENGQRVYFISISSGTLSEYVNVPEIATFPLPDSIDPLQIAASVNPALSAWMALKARTHSLPEDFTCLIIGATSSSGRVAISLARVLGAKKVIGVARNQAVLDTLGLDRTILLANEPQKTDFGDLNDVDVILDYVYGPITSHLLETLQPPKAVQYVQIGSLAAQEITLPGAMLRSKDITVRGAGIGSWTWKALIGTMPDLLAAVPSITGQPVKIVRLENVETEWEYEGPERLVFVP